VAQIYRSALRQKFGVGCSGVKKANEVCELTERIQQTLVFQLTVSKNEPSFLLGTIVDREERLSTQWGSRELSGSWVCGWRVDCSYSSITSEFSAFFRSST
jgi:hypothetical protein